MKKIILGFVGEIASGKGTACEQVIQKHKAGYHRFSTIMRDVLDRLYLDQSRENLQKLSLILREGFGQELFAKVVADDVENDTSNIVCVDGIRRIPDIEFLQKLPNFHLINIVADEKSRFERITKRSENLDDQNKTFEEFQKDQQGETELTIREVAAHATITIDNNGSIEELGSKLDQLISKLNQNEPAA
jgi:dephospho-CoA kinase